ncbi:hypothetical protein I316_03758 [Kwoniella heveanensis BCC8398]|uniref:Uncharacterized protein n=1 Tax=Kwoniella heveanensis BCC8398 TaxID=1296120 RepID=A0A1B9GUZ7_9TREE|nr:hypothetical protein I316_03758 [Kwoniella heveanensis BCC8398]
MTTHPSSDGSGPGSNHTSSSASSFTPLSPAPTLILQALQAQLLPSPIYTQLGSSLQLIAHLQLLSHKIYKEAINVLKLHKRLRNRLDQYGYSEKDKVVLGILNEVEGNKVRDVMESYETQTKDGETLLRFSLDLRQFYIAKLLSTPKMPLTSVKWMIDSYFPDLSSTTAVKVENHPTLYIRCMKQNELGIYEGYREVVMAWYAMSEERAQTETSPLEWKNFYLTDEDNGVSRQQAMIDHVLQAGQQISVDAEALTEIFVHNNTGKVIVDDHFFKKKRNGGAMEESGNLSSGRKEVDVKSDQRGDRVKQDLEYEQQNRKQTIISPRPPPLLSRGPNSHKRPRPRQSFPPTGPNYFAPTSSPSTPKHTHTNWRNDKSSGTSGGGGGIDEINDKNKRLRPFDDSELRAQALKRSKI